jgi:hypothetical protein
VNNAPKEETPGAAKGAAAEALNIQYRSFQRAFTRAGGFRGFNRLLNVLMVLSFYKQYKDEKTMSDAGFVKAGIVGREMLYPMEFVWIHRDDLVD